MWLNAVYLKLLLTLVNHPKLPGRDLAYIVVVNGHEWAWWAMNLRVSMKVRPLLHTQAFQGTLT